MKNADNLLDLKDYGVIPEMFLIEPNRYIFMAINYLYHKKADLNPITIMEVIPTAKMKKAVEEYGGIEYLTLLGQQYVSEGDLKIYSEKLQQAYTRYQLFAICNETQAKMFNERCEVMNPEELIKEHSNQVETLTNSILQNKEVYKMGDNLEEILEERRKHPCMVPGLEVGFPLFDMYTNGGQPGDLIMLCARAKTGKSTMLTNWAVKLGIKDKIPVLYFDTEMSWQEQQDRILSMLSGVPHSEIVSGRFYVDTAYGKAEDKIAKVNEAVKEIKEGKYFHIYMPNFTVEKVQALAKKFKNQEGIQAIFFDYLKFPSSQLNNLKGSSEWQMLGYIASGLKDLAGTLGMPVYSACQENRSNLDGPKDERNVGGSDRILQLASKLIFLYNKSDEQIARERNQFGNQELYIAYQRNGGSGLAPINIKFDKECCTQSEVKF